MERCTKHTKCVYRWIKKKIAKEVQNWDEKKYEYEMGERRLSY